MPNILKNLPLNVLDEKDIRFIYNIFSPFFMEKMYFDVSYSYRNFTYIEYKYNLFNLDERYLVKFILPYNIDYYSLKFYSNENNVKSKYNLIDNYKLINKLVSIQKKVIYLLNLESNQALNEIFKLYYNNLNEYEKLKNDLEEVKKLYENTFDLKLKKIYKNDYDLINEKFKKVERIKQEFDVLISVLKEYKQYSVEELLNILYLRYSDYFGVRIFDIEILFEYMEIGNVLKNILPNNFIVRELDNSGKVLSEEEIYDDISFKYLFYKANEFNFIYENYEDYLNEIKPYEKKAFGFGKWKDRRIFELILPDFYINNESENYTIDIDFNKNSIDIYFYLEQSISVIETSLSVKIFDEIYGKLDETIIDDNVKSIIKCYEIKDYYSDDTHFYKISIFDKDLVEKIIEKRIDISDIEDSFELKFDVVTKNTDTILKDNEWIAIYNNRLIDNLAFYYKNEESGLYERLKFPYNIELNINEDTFFGYIREYNVEIIDPIIKDYIDNNLNEIYVTFNTLTNTVRLFVFDEFIITNDDVEYELKYKLLEEYVGYESLKDKGVKLNYYSPVDTNLILSMDRVERINDTYFYRNFEQQGCYQVLNPLHEYSEIIRRIDYEEYISLGNINDDEIVYKLSNIRFLRNIKFSGFVKKDNINNMISFKYRNNIVKVVPIYEGENYNRNKIKFIGNDVVYTFDNGYVCNCVTFDIKDGDFYICSTQDENLCEKLEVVTAIDIVYNRDGLIYYDFIAEKFGFVYNGFMYYINELVFIDSKYLNDKYDIYLFVDERTGVMRLKYYNDFIDLNIDEHIVNEENSYFKFEDDKLVFTYNNVVIAFSLEKSNIKKYKRENGLLLSSLFYVGNFVPTNSNTFVAGRDNIESSIDMIKNIYDIGDVEDKKSDKQEEYLLVEEFGIEEYFSDLNIDIEPYIMLKNKLNVFKGTDKPLKQLLSRITEDVEFDNVFLVLKNKFLSEWVKISSLNFNDDNVREPLKRLLDDLFEKIRITSETDDVVEFFGNDLLDNKFKDNILVEYFVNLIKEKEYYSKLHDYLVYEYFNKLYVNKLFLYIEENGDDYAKKYANILDFNVYNDMRQLVNLFFYVMELNGEYFEIESHIPIDGFDSYYKYLEYKDVSIKKPYKYLVFDVSKFVEIKEDFEEKDKIYILKPITNDGVTNNNLYRFLDIDIPLSFINLQEDEYNEYKEEGAKVYRYFDYLKDLLVVLQEICIEKGFDFYKINMKVIKWFVEVFIPQKVLTGEIKTYQDFINVVRNEVEKVDDINNIILFNKIKDYLVIGDFGNNIDEIYKSILENYDIKNTTFEILDVDEEYKEYVDKLKMKSEVLADFCIDNKLYDVVTKVLVLFTEDIIATSMLVFKFSLNIRDGIDDEKFLKYEVLITKLIDKFLPFHTVIESFIYLLYIKETSDSDAVSKELDVALNESYLMDVLYQFYEKMKIYVSEYSEAKIDVLYFIISERFRKVFFDNTILSDYLEFINGKKIIGDDFYVLQNGGLVLNVDISGNGLINIDGTTTTNIDGTTTTNIDNIISVSGEESSFTILNVEISFDGTMSVNGKKILNIKKDGFNIVKTSSTLYLINNEGVVHGIDDNIIMSSDEDSIDSNIVLVELKKCEIDGLFDNCSIDTITEKLYECGILDDDEYKYKMFVFIKSMFDCILYRGKVIDYDSLFTDESIIDLPMNYDSNKYKLSGYSYGPHDETEMEEHFYYEDHEYWQQFFYDEDLAKLNPFELSDRILIPRFVGPGLYGHDFEKKVNVFADEYLDIKEDIFFEKPDKLNSFFVDELPTIDVMETFDDELDIETLEKHLIKINSYFEINRLTDEELLHDEFPYDIEDEPDESIALVGATDFMIHNVESYFYDKLSVHLIDFLYMFAKIEYDFEGKIAHDTLGYDEKYIYLDNDEKLDRIVSVGLYDELEYELKFNYKDFSDIKIEDENVYVDAFNKYYDYMSVGLIEKLDIYIDSDIHSFNYNKVRAFDEFEFDEYYHNSDEWRNIEFILSSVAIDKLMPIRIDIRFVRIANVNELSKYIDSNELVRIDDSNSELQKTIIDEKINFIINIFGKDELKIYLNDIKLDYGIHSEFLYDTYGDIIEGIFDERYELDIKYSYSELINVVDKYAEILDEELIVSKDQDKLLDLERDEQYKVSLLDKYYVNVFVRRKEIEREKSIINDYLKEIRIESDDEVILKEFDKFKVITSESLNILFRYYDEIKCKLSERKIIEYLNQITKEKIGIGLMEKILYGELTELDKDKIEIISVDRLKELWYGDILKDSMINVKYNEKTSLDLMVDYEYSISNDMIAHNIGGYEIKYDEFLGRNVDTILKEKLGIETTTDLYENIYFKVYEFNDIDVKTYKSEELKVDFRENIKYYINLTNKVPYVITQYDAEKFDYYGHMYSDSFDIGVSVLPVEKIYMSAYMKDNEYLRTILDEDIETIVKFNFNEEIDLSFKYDVIKFVFVDEKIIEKSTIDLIEKVYITYYDEKKEDISVKFAEDLYYGLKLKDRPDVGVSDKVNTEISLIFKDEIKLKMYDSIVKKIDGLKDNLINSITDELLFVSVNVDENEFVDVGIIDKLVIYREDYERYKEYGSVNLIDKLFVGYGVEFYDHFDILVSDGKLEYGKGIILKDYLRGYFRNYLFISDGDYTGKDLNVYFEDDMVVDIKYSTFFDKVDVSTYERVKYGLVLDEKINVLVSEKIIFGFDFKVKHNPHEYYSYDKFGIDFKDEKSCGLSLNAYLNEKIKIDSDIILKDGIRIYFEEKLNIRSDFNDILEYINIEFSETNLIGFANYDYVINEDELYTDEYSGIYPFDYYTHDERGYETDDAYDKIVSSRLRDSLDIYGDIFVEEKDDENNKKIVLTHLEEKTKFYLESEFYENIGVEIIESLIVSEYGKELSEKLINVVTTEKLYVDSIIELIDRINVYFGEVKTDIRERLVVEYDDGKLVANLGKLYKLEEIYENVDEEIIITLIKYFYYEKLYSNIDDKLFMEIKNEEFEDINSMVKFNRYDIINNDVNVITMYTRVADSNQIFVHIKLIEQISGNVKDIITDISVE